MNDQDPGNSHGSADGRSRSCCPSKGILAIGALVALAALFAVFKTHLLGSPAKTDDAAFVAASKPITPEEAALNVPYETIIRIIRYEDAIAKARDVDFKAYLNAFQNSLGNALLKKRLPKGPQDAKTSQQVESQASTDAMLKTGKLFNEYNEKVKAADQLHAVILPAFRKFIPQKNAEEIAAFIASPAGIKMLEMGPKIDSGTMNQSIRYLESVAVPIRNEIAEEEKWPELKVEYVNKLEEPVLPEGAKLASIRRISEKLDVLSQARRWVVAQAKNYADAWESSYKKNLEPGTQLAPTDQTRVDSFKKKFMERLPARTDMQRIANIGYALQASSYTEEELKAIETFWTSESGSIYVSTLPQIGAEIKKNLAALTGRIAAQIKKQHPLDGSKDLN